MDERNNGNNIQFASHKSSQMKWLSMPRENIALADAINIEFFNMICHA